MEKNYLIIEDNVVTNMVVWNGGVDWTPPTNSIQLIQSDINSKVWQLNADKTDYELVEQKGAGTIGDIWNGLVLTTNLPKPTIIVQSTTGTQTL